MHGRSSLVVLTVALCAMGCGDDGETAGSAGSGGSAAGSSTGDAATGSVTTGTTSGTSTASSASGGAGPGSGGGGSTGQGAGGSGEGGGGVGGGACEAPPIEGTIDYRTEASCADETSVGARLACALELAASQPVFDPPAEEEGHGPDGPQGVVRVAFDPGDAPFEGANELLLDEAVEGSTLVPFPSDVRLEIDAGVSLVWAAEGVDGQIFRWDGVRNVTITRGSACAARGRFVVDLSRVDPEVDRARFVRASDVEAFLLEHVHTLSAFSVDGGPGGGNGSGAPVVLFQAQAGGPSPRFGLYRHHSNQGSPPGWGPNQIASLEDTTIEDIWTEGGNGLRFETSVGTKGSARVTARRVFARNGNAAVSLSPHEASSEDIHVEDVRGVSMFLGVFAGQGKGGVFTGTTVTGGCIVGGDSAQDPSEDIVDQPSRAAVVDQSTAGADVTIEGILRSGPFTAGAPGGTADAGCTAESAMEGLEDWAM